MTADLSDLIERLEKAEEGSLDLSCAVLRATGENQPVSRATVLCAESVDAALALVSRRYPGCGLDCDATAPELGIDWSIHTTGVDPRGVFTGTANTHALAICIALLKALEKTDG